jgi:monoamine oxidase
MARRSEAVTPPGKPARISRRRFAGAMLAAGTGLAVAGCRSAGQKPAPRRDVLVLGAGLAGLAAALQLEAAGVDYQVLEARDRVGGRAFTASDLPDHPEYGGVQIGSSYTRFLALAKRFGLGVGPLPHGHWYRQQVLHYRGETMAPADWAASPVNPLPAALRALPPWRLESHFLRPGNPLAAAADWDTPALQGRDQSIAAAVRAAGAPESVLPLMDITGNHNGIDAISALGPWRSQRIREAAGGPGGGAVVLQAGTQALPQAMAAALPTARLRLQTIVEQISAERDGYEVRLRGGERLRCEQLICALPAAVLPGLKLDLPLAADRYRALQGLPATAITVLQIDTDPFWERDGQPPMMWTDTPLERLFPRVDPASGQVLGLKAFVNGAGARALDALDGPALQDLVTRTLRSVRPALRSARVVGRQGWAADPFAGGAYAAWRPGTVAQVRAAFAAPVVTAAGQQLRFAGEHVASDAPGLEGALRSGESAAAVLLRRRLNS